ncbi:MAG: RNA polymerase sigma factor [Aggregatilineales bacterium]
MQMQAIAVEVEPVSGTIAAITDNDLVVQLQQQDEAALMELYQRYGRLVYSIAFQTLNNQEDAEEVVQDVFLRVWEKGDQFDPTRGKFIAWLTTIARNTSLNRLRGRTRHEPDQPTVSLDASPQLQETLPANHPDRDLQRSITAALHTLSKPQQEAISLAYFYGMSHSEIATHLGRPTGTVKSHIRQGMQKLRQIWHSQDKEQ